MNKRAYEASTVRDAIAGATFLTGLLTLGTTLEALAHTHNARLILGDAHPTVIAGLSLIYLATLLRRGKYNAWLISVGLYMYLAVRNFWHFVLSTDRLDRPWAVILNLSLPTLTLLALAIYRDRFRVKSGLASFALAARRAVLVLVVTFLYGVTGFQLLDHHDFHEEISLPTSIHYTIDQFGLTTKEKPIAHTRRAVVFVDSLAVVSVTSLVYTAAALFSPIRFRLHRSQTDIEAARRIMKIYSTTSEDFFKLWPPDKAYFFNSSRTACIAYKAAHGTALAVGDPVGPPAELEGLIGDFIDYCYVNGWSPAFIHTEGRLSNLYQSYGFEMQKIGEEPIVDTEKFVEITAKDKYFRHINNKFSKAGFSVELLAPPHSDETLVRLKQISDDWLSVPGRAERGFMLGFFTPEYMQLCQLVCVRDSAGQIQAFVNRVPGPKPGEANFDFLRSAESAPGNINDYVMMNFINELYRQSVPCLNMGLSPLSGLNTSGGSDSATIAGLLKLVYAAAGRFYSFQGLRRFKDKYAPSWEPRYIVYKGGVAGFGKTMNALLRAMNL